MSSFKEFLEDYEKKELERIEKFLKRLEEGKISLGEIYPPKNRFIKLKEPIAFSPAGAPVWSVVPFYGSTIITLVPRSDKSKFDEFHNLSEGFTSRDIDKMIDLVKETGRIQFVISNFPTFYKNLEFLEPLFTELNPPMIPNTLLAIIGERKYKEYFTEFDTLAQFGFKRYISHFVDTRLGKDYIHKIAGDYAFSYIALKFLGYDELVEEIEYLMITNPHRACQLFTVFGNMIALPSFNSLKGICNFRQEELTAAYELGKPYGIEPRAIPCEIGRFILRKLVRYPENLNGCWEIIQYYDDNELYKVLNALNEGVKEKKIDIIKDKRIDLNEILDTIWNETAKIKRNADIARVAIGLLGCLSANLSSTGVLAGLGFAVIDKIVGLKLDSVGEKFAKFFSPNYLVTIYDFKKKNNIQK